MASPMSIGRRDLSGTIDGVKSSFSSWDACMSKAYCKWPVIAAIIIGGLIVFSLLYCCARCLCCGAQCCCGCLSCCNACCPSPRKGHRRVESPPPTAFPNNQQYQSQPPPMYSGPGWNQSNVPQYATFDVSSDKKFNEDALPAMPTWDTAKSTKVEVHEEQVKEQPDDMEMQRLDMKPGTSPTNSSVGPSPITTHSPAPQSEYGFPVQPQPIHPANANFSNGDFYNGHDQSGYFNGQQQQNPYGMSRHASPSPYGQDHQQPYHYANDPYGQQAYGQDRGAGGYGQPYDTASSVGGYAPSHAPTGYAPSGSTRYEPSMHNTYQDSYQHPPPMPPIDRAGTASPYQSYGAPRPPLDRAATASPYQAFNAPRPPVERSQTGSPWERFGANRSAAPGGYRDI